MSYLKTKGIVIREVNTGEADKIVTLFTRSHGKISAVTKGARRPKSKLIGGSQFLCYSEFMLFKGRDMYLVNSCDVVEPFYEIRNDIVKLTYSAHMVDLINDIVQENQPSNRVLQLFLNTLYMLAKTDRNPELVCRIFEIRLMTLVGYAPSVKGCTVCGREEPGNGLAFSFKNCGFLCSDDACSSNDRYALNITAGTVRALRHIVHARIEELFHFNVSREVLDELKRISGRYLKDRLERDYTKLDFLKTLGL